MPDGKTILYIILYNAFRFSLVRIYKVDGIADSEILGRGEFGIVYKGSWNEKSVAVKRIKLENVYESDDKAIQFLKDAKHDNITALYCSTATDKIYKY